MSEQPPPERTGFVSGLIETAKGLSLTNAAVIILLVLVLVPAYLLYMVFSDPTMMSRFLSHYTEVASEHSPCTIRIASLSGGPEVFAISTGFAYEGSDRYTVGVIIEHKPSEAELLSYCTTLTTIVDFMRRPDAPSPNFPGTDRPLIWQYPQEVQ